MRQVAQPAVDEDARVGGERNALGPDVVDATARAPALADNLVCETRLRGCIGVEGAVGIDEALLLEALHQRVRGRGGGAGQAVKRGEALVEVAQHDHLLHADSPLHHLGVQLLG